MSSVSHDVAPATATVTTTTGTTTTRITRPGSCAGSRRPTTRTSARCTCGSRSRCSSSAASWRSRSVRSCSSPGLQIVNPEFFNSMTTLHGLIMIFGAIMPAAVGFANWMIPLMIGAPDMAFARMNNWSFWLLPPAAILLISSLFVPGGAAAAGWTMYPPLSVQAGHGHGPHDLRRPHHGRVVDHGLDQHHHDDPQPARARHDADEDAALLLDLAHHRVPADRGDAGARRRGDDAAHRPPLRHVVLQCGRRRRPGAVPARVLVLRPPRGLHHDPAGVRDHLADHPDVLAQAALRLRVDGVRRRGHRDPVVHRVGAPHVHDGHADRRACCSSCTRRC